jgi:O-antigen biosynthesis protein
MITSREIAVAVAASDGARAASLRRCVVAVAAGTLLPTRLLVVDQSGGSEIATVLAALASPFELECVPQPGPGLSASRNEALDRLSEQIVAVTDDDCVPDPEWLAAIAAAFTDDPELAAVTGPVLPLPPVGERTAAVSSRLREEQEVFAHRAAPWHVGTGGNMALNRHRLGDRRFDTRLGAGTRGRAGEDVDLIDRLLAAGERIRYEPAAVVRHERQTPARRIETRYAYGHGVGAMIGFRLRRRDVGGLRHLVRWVALRARLAARRRAFAEELRVLAGTVAGIAYAIRVR